MGKIKELIKAKKALAATVSAVVVGTAIIITILIFGGYRTIVAEEVNGTVAVQKETKETADAYVGQHFHTGDDVRVKNESDMTMSLDMDKFVYAEPETHFWLEVAGNRSKGRTKIHLDQGSELNVLKTALKDGEDYEIDTPSSVMSVRGTVFRVTVYEDAAGISWAVLDVFDGSVKVDLKTIDGKFNGVSETFHAGESALIRANTEFSEFVKDGDGDIRHDIKYKEIPQNTAKKLVKVIDDGIELCIGKELLMDYTRLTDHKFESKIVKEASCTEEGLEELCCTVCGEVKEERVIPKLAHKTDKWEIIEDPEFPYTEVLKCKVCGEIVKRQPIDMANHKVGERKVELEPTCLKEGKAVIYCKDCKHAIKEEIIPKTGHKAATPVIEKAAGCTNKGVEVIKCSVCGAEIERKEIPALGHHPDPKWYIKQQASCNSTGIEVQRCTRCGREITTRPIPTTGHQPSGNWEVQTAATCGTEGVEVERCSICGAVVNKRTIPANGNHVWDTEKWFMLTEQDVANVPLNKDFPVEPSKLANKCQNCESYNPISYTGEKVPIYVEIDKAGNKIYYYWDRQSTAKGNILPLNTWEKLPN